MRTVSAIALILRIPILFVRGFDTDEFEHLHAARSIYHGMVPYRDYFEVHTPFLHFFLAPLYLFFGDQIALLFVARGIMLILTCGILYLTYRLTHLLYGFDAALYAVLFLSYMIMFLEKTIEVRPDVPGLIFWLLALIFLISGIRHEEGYEKKRRWDFLLSGLMMSSAILCTQKALFAAMGLTLALVWLLFDKRTELSLRERAVSFWWVGLGLMIPVSIVCLYFLLNGALDDFIYRNFIMTAQWKTRFWPYIYIQRALKQNPFFCAFGLMGLMIATTRLREKENASNGGLAPVLSTYMLLIGLFLMPIPYRQYFLLFLPLLAMYCGLALETLIQSPLYSQIRDLWRERKYFFIGLTIVEFIILAIALGSVLLYGEFSIPTLIKIHILYLGVWIFIFALLAWCFVQVKGRYHELLLIVVIIASPLNQTLGQILVVDSSGESKQLRLNRSNEGQLNEIRFILQNTRPEDTVFDGWTGSGVFRNHAYYYYFLPYEIRKMLTQKESSEGVINALREKRPKIVIYDANVQALSADVKNYIEANYKPTGVGELYMESRAN
ncbi:glycosyltransferase family 39 protein [Candidatus Poribacteria bacterium]|nr:glycosyltransferase family 39 protein [Candidatus Poribacteria bacterium]